MFRYRLNPYSCQWEIQLLRWGFFWTTLRGVCFDNAAGYFGLPFAA